MSKELNHYGVKGMHWGVRNADRAVEGAKAARDIAGGFKKKDPTKTTIRGQVNELGGLHAVSDKQLQAMLNRMNMEQQYKKFMQSEAERRANGKKAALKALLKVGKIALPIIISAYAGKVAAPTVIRSVSEYQKSIGS